MLLSNATPDIEQAADLIAQGQCIAYPTEGVYGLGCDPFNASAVKQLETIKGRPKEKSFIIIAATWEQVAHLVAPLTPKQQLSLKQTWPGPFTWLLPMAQNLPYHLQNPNGKIAIRLTNHPIARALCHSAGQCLTSTSANLSGKPALSDAASVADFFGHQLAAIIDAPCGNLSKPTPIRDLVTKEWIRK